jgi:glycosyltransferase involved in cell wall biosynthesis
MRILMASVGDISTDARVQKEAASLSAAGHSVRVLAFDYTLKRPATRVRAGVEYVLHPFPPRGSPHWKRLAGGARFYLWALAKLLASPAGAVHSHNLHFALPLLAVARLRRARFVYDAHELVVHEAAGKAQPLMTRYERIVWTSADAAITTNPSRAARLHDLHGGTEPLVVGNHPVRPAEITPVDLRATLGIPADRKILLYQGGFYLDNRCFDVAAQALALLPGWHWVLVGFGSEKTIATIQGMLDRAGVADRATILPPASLEELLDVTAGADLGIIPLANVSLNTYLGDTNKLYEYLMAGIPAVGSDFPEIRRTLLADPAGPLGAVFDPSDPASIAVAVKEVEDALPELRPRAWRAARERYAWQHEEEKLTALYRALSPRGED